MFILFLTHFFWDSVSIKSLPCNSFSLLYLEISTPMNRFMMKKFPRITTATKKRETSGLEIWGPVAGIRSFP